MRPSPRCRGGWERIVEAPDAECAWAELKTMRSGPPKPAMNVNVMRLNGRSPGSRGWSPAPMRISVGTGGSVCLCVTLPGLVTSFGQCQSYATRESTTRVEGDGAGVLWRGVGVCMVRLGLGPGDGPVGRDCAGAVVVGAPGGEPAVGGVLPQAPAAARMRANAE